MSVDERSHDHPDEALIRRAVRGALEAPERADLDRHLAACPTCGAALEAMRIFHIALARDAEDDARDREAVERVLARLGERESFDVLAAGPRDEALNRAAVEMAMARLGERRTFRSRAARLLRQTAGFAAIGAAAAVIVFAVSQGPRTPPTTSAASAYPLVTADGSEIAPESAATTFHVTEETPARTTVSLPVGAARFRVRHDVRRLFRVHAGSIEIEDLGTVFRVAHEPEGRVRVTVSEGRVAVLSAAGRLRVELGAGEERVFSSAPAAHDVPDEPTAAARTAAPARGVRGQPRVNAADDPAGLLAAADVARRSRSPREAVAPLRRLVERYPRDPRAPSAAFTLGWVLLTDLNRPREAAAAFADAERIAPRGTLAEDAAARVAEAWQNAGEPRRAAAAARHYAQMYPTGRYIVLMRGLIGEN